MVQKEIYSQNSKVEYNLKPTKFLLEQINELSPKAKSILKEKFNLLKIHPARFKQIEGYPYNLFRIRFQDLNKSKRLIYSIDKNEIKLLCIINRDKDYKQLDKYLSKFKKDKFL